MKKKKGWISKCLTGIEVVGNKLPHPVTIFILLTLIIIGVSEICAKLGVSVSYQQIDRSSGQIKDMTMQAVGLFNPEGLRYMVTHFVSNFTGFAPLGTVLVAMLGVVLADGSGLIGAVLRKMVLNTPKRLVTAVVVFAGILSNVAADVGYVILVPLGAMIFASFGRHPIAGLAAAFAGVSGGFSANLLIGALDPMLSGLTMEAAKIYDPSYTVLPTANWYFMIVSTFVIMILGTIITEKVVEPRLGEYHEKTIHLEKLHVNENRGLKWALISLLVFLLLLGITLLPGGVLRNPDTGSIFENSPFINGIVPIIALFFMIPGIFFGIGSGNIRSDQDVVRFMGEGMSTMGAYLVLAFFSAQFVNYFTYTNLGVIIAVKGANFLEHTGFTGLWLLIAFVLVAAFINLFLGSSTAKWAIMAPIFVPMFMQIGFSPELTQVAYRIGDSVTNVISPLMSYFAVIIAFAEKYDKKAGIGTIVSTMLPYSLTFLVGWILLLVVWYLIGLPLGPMAPLFLTK